MVAPVKLNPRTVVALFEMVKSASPAAPPPALNTPTPSTLNWKPAIGVSLSKYTNTVSDG